MQAAARPSGFGPRPCRPLLGARPTLASPWRHQGEQTKRWEQSAAKHLPSPLPRRPSPPSRLPPCRHAAVSPRRLLVSVKAQAEPEPDAYCLEQPPVLPNKMRGRHWRPEQLDAVAAVWRSWVEQQYAALQSDAGSLRSFTAVSWQHLGPAAGPLRLADFFALLNPERLQEVSLVLSGGEPLPLNELAMLARFPQLRSLSIQHDIDTAAKDEVGQQVESLAVAALCELKQLTSLSLEMGHVPHALVQAVQCLPQLERLQIVGQGALLPESADFPGSFPSLRHLHLAPAWGEFSSPLPRPADFPSLQSFVYEETAPGTDYATLWVSHHSTGCFTSAPQAAWCTRLSTAGAHRLCLQVQGQKGGSMRSGQWVRFQDGELAVLDRDSDQEGIENLQAFVDAMLPAGQELHALVTTKVGQTYQFALESHTCRQLATTTRLELRDCFMHFPMLLRQVPNLRELVMEQCAQRNEGNLFHTEGEETGDVEEEKEYDLLTWHAVPAAALPASLTRLCLMGTNLMEHDCWPAMPGAEGCARFVLACMVKSRCLLPVARLKTATPLALEHRFGVLGPELRHFQDPDPSAALPACQRIKSAPPAAGRKHKGKQKAGPVCEPVAAANGGQHGRR